jgi:hypothetical protein
MGTVSEKLVKVCNITYWIGVLILAGFLLVMSSKVTGYFCRSIIDSMYWEIMEFLK